MNCKDCEKLLVEALYDELSAPQKQQFQAHIDDCKSCREAFLGMQATLQIMNKRERSEPQSAFWDNYWDNLEDKLEVSPTARPKTAFMHSWTFRLMAAAVVLISGIFIGREWSSLDRQLSEDFAQENLVVPDNRQNNVPQILNNPQGNPSFASRAVQMRAANYLDRSKVLVLGLINLDEDTDELDSFDFSQHTRVSNELLQEAGYLKQALNTPQSRRLQSLVVDLEAILLEIATLSQQSDIPSVERVRTDVENRGILFKINMEELRRQLKENDLKTQQETI